MDTNFIINETISLSKIKYDDRIFYDTLTIYGFALASFSNEFIFILAERQNINSKLKKKVVRTTALQISTTSSLNELEEFYQNKQCNNDTQKFQEQFMNV